jgi:hypothetical protein
VAEPPSVEHAHAAAAEGGRAARRRLQAALAAWVVLSMAGAVVLLLPDTGRRLVAFSGAHGLTPLDALGTTLLLVGWLLALGVVLRRPELRTQAAAHAARGPRAFAVGLGVGLIVASVFADFAGWWAVGAMLLAALQLYWFVRIAGTSWAGLVNR